MESRSQRILAKTECYLAYLRLALCFMRRGFNVKCDIFQIENSIGSKIEEEEKVRLDNCFGQRGFIKPGLGAGGHRSGKVLIEGSCSLAISARRDEFQNRRGLMKKSRLPGALFCAVATRRQRCTPRRSQIAKREMRPPCARPRTRMTTEAIRVKAPRFCQFSRRC